MKVYAQFLTLDTKNEICDLLGTDGVFVLDGRKSISTWTIDIQHQINRLKNVQPDIVGYKIIRASDFRSNGSVAHEWIDKRKIKSI